jgi:hypothetical protein
VAGANCGGAIADWRCNCAGRRHSHCTIYLHAFLTLFSVVPSQSEESSVDASLRCAPFSMTDWEHGRFAQHDSTESLFCPFHSERSEESSVDAALSATGTLTSPQPSPSQKERDIFAIPSASEESTHGCFTTLSMTGWGQQTSPSGPSPCKRRGTFWRKPKQGEVARSSEHFFVIPSIFFCHSKRSFLSFRARARNPVRGCFALLSMTQ